MSSRRVSFSPDVQQNPTILIKHGNITKVSRTNRQTPPVAPGICTFRRPKSSSKYSPGRILRRLGAKVARVVCFGAKRRKKYSSSRKVSSSSSSSSSSSVGLVRSRSVADAIDSQRAEAIEDCIEFLNASSSLQRCNSVSSTCKS